jgi:hypothetical protein
MATDRVRMDTNDLNYPMMLERQLSRRLSTELKTPPDFTATNQAFSSFMANPALMRGPGGGVMDPRTEQNTMGSNWLQERGQIAGQSLMDKDQIAQLLLQTGSTIGSLFSSQVGLNAAQLNSGNSASTGILGGL